MYDHKEPLENICSFPMLHIIAQHDKAYDKCHHLLDPFKSNGTVYFYQMNQSIFVLGLFGVVFHSCFQILIEYPVSKQ